MFIWIQNIWDTGFFQKSKIVKLISFSSFRWYSFRRYWENSRQWKCDIWYIGKFWYIGDWSWQIRGTISVWLSKTCADRFGEKSINRTSVANIHIHTRPKRKISLMFVVISWIFFTFARCECGLMLQVESNIRYYDLSSYFVGRKSQ